MTAKPTYLLAIEEQRSLGGSFQEQEKLRQRRFTRPRLSHNAQCLPLGHVDMHAIYSLNPAPHLSHEHATGQRKVFLESDSCSIDVPSSSDGRGHPTLRDVAAFDRYGRRVRFRTDGLSLGTRGAKGQPGGSGSDPEAVHRFRRAADASAQHWASSAAMPVCMDGWGYRRPVRCFPSRRSCRRTSPPPISVGRHDAEIVGHQDDRHSGLGLHLLQQFQILRLNGDV